VRFKLSIKSLYKRFGTKEILCGVNLDVNEGEILCVIGRSGTGKSVILKHLIGLLQPDAGEVWVDDEQFTGASADDQARITGKFGVLFQGAALFDSMNIYDNVAFGMRRRNIPEEAIAQQVPELLAKVGLHNIEEKRPSDLSGGMQKRVGLARSLAIKPEIMLYDEPTTGVDPITGGTVDRLIVEMNRDLGITSVVITHDMESVKRIAHRVAMLYEGKIIFTGTPDELFRTEDPMIRQFIEGRAA
jgi:phospholipid/cholesterol/gamma-HCH transport system ATP-binding protein